MYVSSFFRDDIRFDGEFSGISSRLTFSTKLHLSFFVVYLFLMLLVCVLYIYQISVCWCFQSMFFCSFYTICYIPCGSLIELYLLYNVSNCLVWFENGSSVPLTYGIVFPFLVLVSVDVIAFPIVFFQSSRVLLLR